MILKVYYNEEIDLDNISNDDLIHNATLTYNYEESKFIDESGNNYIFYLDTDNDCIFIDLVDDNGDDLGGNFKELDLDIGE